MADEETNENTSGDADIEASTNAAEAAPKKSGMMVVIIISFLVMSITPLLSYIVVKKTLPKPVDTVTPEKAEEETSLDIEAITVNIFGTRGTRILRLKIHLVFSEGRIEETLKTLEPVLVDRIITAASRMTLDELEGAKGQEALKKDIISEVNSSIKEKMEGALIKVYFRDFLIQ